MHATFKGTSCNIGACIPCGKMLDGVGSSFKMFKVFSQHFEHCKMLCVVVCCVCLASSFRMLQDVASKCCVHLTGP